MGPIVIYILTLYEYIIGSEFKLDQQGLDEFVHLGHKGLIDFIFLEKCRTAFQIPIWWEKIFLVIKRSISYKFFLLKWFWI